MPWFGAARAIVEGRSRLTRSTLLMCLCAALAAPGAAQIAPETAGDLLAQGRLDEASARLDARLVSNPRDIQARFLKGLVLSDQGKRKRYTQLVGKR